MPELPEIETVRLQLQQVLPGQSLVKVIVNSKKIVQGDFTAITNKKVLDVRRMGKVLLINFGPPSRKASEGQALMLGFHFKMTGQLIYEPTNHKLTNRIVGGHPTEDFVNKMPSSHTRIIFEFDRGTLYFNDQRMFGWVMLNPKFVDKLGPEPFDMAAAEFINRVSKSKRPIKLVLMDQEVISGVGNIYANDALWEASIDPRCRSDQLTSGRLSVLFDKLKLVLSEGIKYGGATAADAKYIDLHGLGGHYQDHFRVYDRAGLPCHCCKTRIKKFVLGGRGTYYCPQCQMG